MKILSALALFFITLTSYSQNSTYNWVKSPSAEHGFSPNTNRFEPIMDEDIAFYTKSQGFTVFFSNDALIIGRPYLPTTEEAKEIREHKERGEAVDVSKPWYFFKIEFEGSNSDVNIVPSALNQHTNNFQNPQNLKETVRSTSYKTLTYQNIYNGIDLILEVPLSGGLKYSFKVHPGADYQQIKMKYINATPALNGDGLSIETTFDPFTDRAPTGEVAGQLIDASFNITDQIVSFNIAAYDPTKTLIIDPWLETGLDFAVFNGAFEVEYDYTGEVTIMGNYGEQVSHYDNTGLLEWTWTEPGTDPFELPFITKLGDLEVDPGTGNIYYLAGFAGGLYYIDPDGVVMDIHMFDFATELQEQWRLYFNETDNEIWCGGGNPISAPDLERMNADMTGEVVYNTLISDDGILLDVTLIEMNTTEDTIYFLSCAGGGFGGAYSNELICVSRADPLGIIWQSPTGHGFQEVANIDYYPDTDFGLSGNGFNGIVCGERYVYTYNGDMLQQYDKNTGAILGTTTIGQTEFTHAGIDMDFCGNIYLGTDDSIMIFNDGLNQIGSILAPDTTYDLLIEGDRMYLGGYDFVAEMELDIKFDVITSLEATDATCGCFGSATVAIDPGSPCLGFEYVGLEWSPGGETTETIEDLCGGWYYVTATWVNDVGEFFTQTDSVEVGTSEEGYVVDVLLTHEACEGSCNGSATLTPDAGEAPFEYDLDGTINATGIFDGLCAGTYTASVVDSEGCESEVTFTIESGEGLGLAVVTVNNPTCYGFSDGSITVETADGVGEVTYEWVPENELGGSVFNTASAGTYVVHASTDAGCTDSLVIVLTDPDSLYATINTTDILCNGDSTGTAVVDSVYNAQGDLANISYFWTPNYFGADGVGVDSAYNMPAGSYVLLINDDNGCSHTQTFDISQPEPIVFVELGTYPALCRLYNYQSGNGAVFASASGGVADYTYNWVNLTNMESSDNSTWGGINPGLYEITVTDNNGCTLIQTITLDSLNPLAAFTVNSDQLDENCEGTELVEASFTNQSSGFSNNFDSGADTLFSWNLNNPLAPWFFSYSYFDMPDTSYTGEAVYEVCLIAFNSNGCADTTCKNIIVHVQPEFTTPNVFSPGTDGINDLFTFEFKAYGIETFQCTIVNRWGIVVGEINDISDGWDGTDKNGDPCTNGTYFYTYEAVSTNETVYKGQGNVQLVRE